MTGKSQEVAAHRAVNNAVKRGDMPPANLLSCIDCEGRAIDYHHRSYEQSRWLDVIPLCRPCHRTRHLESDPNYMEHGRRKLTPIQVKELRQLASDTKALREAAARLGINYTTAMSAARGYTYKWVKQERPCATPIVLSYGSKRRQEHTTV